MPLEPPNLQHLQAAQGYAKAGTLETDFIAVAFVYTGRQETPSENKLNYGYRRQANRESIPKPDQ